MRVPAKARATLAMLFALFARDVVAADYPAVLPPESDVRKALSESPRLKAAREMLTQADARRRQIEVGPHEWNVGVLAQKRKDPVGANSFEQSYELSRGLRWPGKAGIDRAIGQQVAATGESAYSDAWHEAARSLLSGWFEWLRAVQRATLADAEVSALERQLAIVQSRLRSGDAARLEQSLAQNELDRGVAAQAAARLQSEQLAIDLKRSFPDLVLSSPMDLGVPHLPDGSDEDWLQRILGDNHEIELADGQYEQARLVAQRAARDRLADPNVSLRFSPNLDGNDRVIGVAVSLPIGGARRTAESAIARSEANIAAERAREVRLKVQGDGQQAVLAMRSTHAQWTRLADVAERTAASAEQVSRGYALGEFTTTELLTARRQANEAALAATSGRLAALESVARLQLDTHAIWALEPASARVE